jgi:hypothetical protein
MSKINVTEWEKANCKVTRMMRVLKKKSLCMPSTCDISAQDVLSAFVPSCFIYLFIFCGTGA